MKDEQELVLSCLPMVTCLAQRLFPPGTHDGLFRARGTWDDLLAEGHVALCRAARRFDPARGIKFVTYAWRAVLNALITYRQERGLFLHGPRPRGATSYPPPRVYLWGDHLPEGLHPREKESGSQQEEIYQLVGQLPVADQELLRLHYEEGWSLRKIAREQALSYRILRRQLRSIFAQLHRQLVAEEVA